MKTSEPKMILNLSLEDEELQKKVALAMDDYVEKIVIANLDNTIKKIVENRINKLVNADRWSQDGKIAGVSLHEYVKSQTEKVIEEAIDKNIKEVFAKKIAEML